ARTLDSDVKTMVVMEVAIAACTTQASGMPARGKSMAIKGTSTMPPPIPRKPAKKPTTPPSNKRLTMKKMSMCVCVGLQERGLDDDAATQTHIAVIQDR